MSDLISRSYVIDLLYKTFDEYRIATDKTSTLGGFGSEVFKRVREMPTVYDIDKVVDELKELKAYAVYEDINADTKWLDKAIEIVKQGGVSDDVCEPSADKIKVTSLEVIVTGKREKPYYEIKYKEVGEIDYKIGYSSYDLNNVFAWRDKFFEIVNHK